MCKLVKIIWILHRGFTRSQKQLKWVLLRGVYAVWALAISQTPPRKYSFLVVCDLYVNWAVWAVPLSQFQAMRIISGTSRHPRDVTSSLPNFPVAQFFSVVHFCCCPIFPCPFSVAFFRCRFYLLPSVMTVGVIRRRKPCLLMPASSPACWRRWIRWNCGRSLVNKPLMNSAWIMQLYRESTTYTNAKKTPVHPSNRSHAHNAGKTFDFPLQPTISSLLIHYKPLDTGVRNPSQDDKIIKNLTAHVYLLFVSIGWFSGVERLLINIQRIHLRPKHASATCAENGAVPDRKSDEWERSGERASPWPLLCRSNSTQVLSAYTTAEHW